jgi:hypothetical protein
VIGDTTLGLFIDGKEAEKIYLNSFLGVRLLQIRGSLTASMKLIKSGIMLLHHL